MRALASSLNADGVFDFTDADKLQEVVTRDGAVSADERATLQELLGSLNLTPDARAVLAQLAPALTPERALAAASAAPGWALITPEVQTRLEAVLSDPTDTLSAAARAKLGELTSNPGWARATPQQQADALTGLLNLGLGGASRRAAPPLPEGPGLYQKLDETQVASHRFPYGEELPATQTRLNINGVPIDVFTPLSPLPPGTWTPSVDQIARALSALPPEVLVHTTTVSVSPSVSPLGPGATMAANGTGEMYCYPQPVADTPWNLHILTATVFHESGHNLSIAKWGSDVSSPDWQKWAAAEQQDGTSASSYANTNPLEDFAETFVLYLASRGTPAADEYRAIFPARWALIDQLMSGD